MFNELLNVTSTKAKRCSLQITTDGDYLFVDGYVMVGERRFDIIKKGIWLFVLAGDADAFTPHRTEVEKVVKDAEELFNNSIKEKLIKLSIHTKKSKFIAKGHVNDNEVNISSLKGKQKRTKN